MFKKRTNNSPHIVNPVRWRDAWKSLLHLSNDNENTVYVFEIVDALRGDSERASIERMKQTPIGGEIIREGRSLLKILKDRERIAALPEGSLGHEYLAFMDREGLTVDGLAGAAREGYKGRILDPELQTFMSWARDSHDLWHVVTGYGRDPLGELCLLGFLYSQIRSRGTGFIALGGLLQTPSEYPGAPSIRAVFQGFYIGYRAKSLMAQDWEELLKHPLEEVRSELGIRHPYFYERSYPMHDARHSRNKVVASAAKARFN